MILSKNRYLTRAAVSTLSADFTKRRLLAIEPVRTPASSGEIRMGLVNVLRWLYTALRREVSSEGAAVRSMGHGLRKIPLHEN
jgi:hypothetical protein